MNTAVDRPLNEKLFHFTAALLLLSLLFLYAFSRLDYQWNWDGAFRYRSKFIDGWFRTIAISVSALFCSVVIGVSVALLRRQRILLFRYFARIYVEVIRGTPLLVQIIIFFYVVADAVGLQNRYVVGVATLSLFSGAYIAEMIRAGIENISKSQLDSAKAVGFTRAQTYRYVIFPQAIRQTLPPLAGQFVSLIKDSSLLSVIAISEFTLNAQEVNSNTYSPFESYLPLAVGYLILTLPISVWTQRLEKRIRYET